MAASPKSFWGKAADVDPEQQWITAYDDSPLLALEAELIYATTSRGLSWESVLDMELWQVAAALGIHRIETRAQRDTREIVEVSQAYFEETGEDRRAYMNRDGGYRARREESRRRRQQERRGERESMTRGGAN